MSSTSFFEKVANDAEKVEEELLGPDYKYYQQIKTPDEMGMSDAGSISALGRDINGIINYVELLITGGGNANKSKGGRPLGDRFFLKTGGQCKDVATGNLVDRYMYIDNIPDGSIPFVSSGTGYKFTTFEGLIPGILSDIDKINPMDMFKAFMQDSEPPCQEVTLETVNREGAVGSESRYLPLDEIAVIESNQKNAKVMKKPAALKRAPVPAKKEGFTVNDEDDLMTRVQQMVSSDNVYLLMVGMLYLYIFSRFISKTAFM